MKEGYLQTKIAEINDKCKKIEQMISMEESKIVLLQERVGGLKELIKKLKDLQEFKDTIIRQINSGNKKIITEEIEKLSKNVSDTIDSTLNTKTKKINETLEYLKSREEEVKNQANTILKQNRDINYLLEHNNLLMMKLVNKGILSDREVNELHNRSVKK